MNDLISAIKLNLQDTPKLRQPRYDDRGIRGVVIGMLNNHTSTVGVRNVLQSIKKTKSEIEAHVLDATTPLDLNIHLEVFGLTLGDWSYPKSPAEQWIDPKTGLRVNGYAANDWTKVVACMVSHMRAWKFAVDINRPIMVLEHDAVFERKFMFDDVVDQFTGGILGLNNPLGATRRSRQFYDSIVNQATGNHPQVFDAPWIDDKSIPQGIAGNSAYLIKPEPAQMLLDKISEIGLWPNDALMCKQLFPWLQVAYPFYTSLQGIKSTTQG